MPRLWYFFGKAPNNWKISETQENWGNVSIKEVLGAGDFCSRVELFFVKRPAAYS